MFPFIETTEYRHGAQAHLPWEEKSAQRRSRPERLRFSAPAPGAPLVTVVRPPPEQIVRAGGSWGWLARLLRKPAQSPAVL